MKMLSRTGLAEEPAWKEITSPVAEDGSRLVTRTVQLTVEREVLSVLLHHPGASFAGPCPECGCEVMLLTVDTAAHLAQTNPRAIYRSVEAAELHFQETSAGKVFICSESLKRTAGKLAPP